MASTNYWWIALNAVEQKVKSLNLPGINPSQVRIQTVGIETDFSPRRGVSIFPWGVEGADPNAGTNAADDLEYPVAVMIIDSKKENEAASLETRLLWRQTIIDSMLHVDLTYNGDHVAGHYDTVIKPGRFADLLAWFDRQTWTSPFVVGWRQRRRGNR